MGVTFLSLTEFGLEFGLDVGDALGEGIGGWVVGRRGENGGECGVESVGVSQPCTGHPELQISLS